jgi:hypothetical protein
MQPGPWGLMAQPTSTQMWTGPVSPRGRPGPRRSPIGRGIRGVGDKAVKVITLIAHMRHNCVHTASTCSFGDPVGVELDHSHPFFLGVVLRPPPPSLNGSV